MAEQKILLMFSSTMFPTTAYSWHSSIWNSHLQLLVIYQAVIFFMHGSEVPQQFSSAAPVSTLITSLIQSQHQCVLMHREYPNMFQSLYSTLDIDLKLFLVVVYICQKGDSRRLLVSAPVNVIFLPTLLVLCERFLALNTDLVQILEKLQWISCEKIDVVSYFFFENASETETPSVCQSSIN